MKMSTTELSELKSRSLVAIQQGYKVAHVESHVANLKLETGEVALPADPRQAVVVLIDLVEAIRAGRMTAKVKQMPKAAEPVKAAPPKPELAKVEPKPAPVVVPEPVTVAVVEPVAAPVVEPVVEVVAAPVVEPVAEIVAAPVAEPVAEPVKAPEPEAKPGKGKRG